MFRLRYRQTNGAIVRGDARSPRALGRRRKMSDMAALTLENPLFATHDVAASLMVLKAVSMFWLTVARMMPVRGGLRLPKTSGRLP
jgi:hypothetical protein